MLTPEEIFMSAFSEELEASAQEEEHEMPILAKLASNLELQEEGEIEMPIFDKLAANVEGASAEEVEVDFDGMNPLEKLAFDKWAGRNGLTKEALVDWIKEKGKGAIEAGKGALKGKDWTAAEKKLETAKGKKPKSLRLFSSRKAKAGVSAAEKGVAAAKSKRLGLGKKLGIGGGAALLTAGAIKAAIGGRKKEDK